MRIESIVLFTCLLTACGTKPSSLVAKLNAGVAVHNYVLVITGANCAIAAVINTPNSGQAMDPPGGGQDTLGAGGATLSISDTTADPQVSAFGGAGCVDVIAKAYKDGVFMSSHTISGGIGPWDFGYL